LELYQGVSIGGGIGSISDILDASQMILENVCIHTLLFFFLLVLLAIVADMAVGFLYF
jgi:hypothetical protein